MSSEMTMPSVVVEAAEASPGAGDPSVKGLADTGSNGGPPSHLAGVEQFLQSLARAIYQFRVYPSGSPFREEAVSAAERSLALVDPDGLEARVTERELVVDATAFGAGTLIERELARRMHRASIGRLRIRAGSNREDLALFCNALIQVQTENASLAELLVERGVERIEVEATCRPEIVELGAQTHADVEVARRERDRREALFSSGGPVHHLYPPDRGWIRVDPSSAITRLSLPELAILIKDPVRLAETLLRLSGEDPDALDAGSPLERKFSDLATVFASLEPHQGRVMFARLAEAVLALDTEARTRLLKRTVLPGLLEGRVDGAILPDFPDVALADALCLLLELEVAAPEVLGVALAKLDLPEDRRDAVLPVLTERLRERGVSNDAPGSASSSMLDRYARKLIQINADRTRSFEEFAAFDVSLDDATLASVERIREAVGATDLADQQLRCLSSLVRLEPSPERVESFLSSMLGFLVVLEAQEKRETVAGWLGALREISTSVEARRPQVAECIASAFQRFSTRARAAWLGEAYQTRPAARSLVSAYVQALGRAIAPAFATLLDDEHARASLPSLSSLMCDHAAVLAPGLVPELGHRSAAAIRGIIRTLGRAGAGYEATIADHLTHADAMLGREALRALVRIGTPQAAGIVAAHLAGPTDSLREAAAEALSRFPPAVANAPLRSVLRRNDFVVQYPELVLQLLKRADMGAAHGFEQELRTLATLRRRFWRPALMRIASKARELLAS